MPSLAVSDAEYEEVGEACFWVGDAMEGKGLVHRLAVLVPEANDFGFGLFVFGSSGLVALVERRAVIIFEEILGGRCSR